MKFQDWLSTVAFKKQGYDMQGQYSGPTSTELAVIFQELQTNRVSISCGKFPLTYNMLGSVSSLFTLVGV